VDLVAPEHLKGHRLFRVGKKVPKRLDFPYNLGLLKAIFFGLTWINVDSLGNLINNYVYLVGGD
jgi:hypothetical protein